VEIEFVLGDESIECQCTVKARYRTGVEMESLTGVSVALLTVWDMVKYLEKDYFGQYPRTSMNNIRVVSKKKE
jgi:cyclic pyranopterin phosphate synthase